MKKTVEKIKNSFKSLRKYLSKGGLKTNPKYVISLFIVSVGILSLLGGTSYAILRGTATSNEEQLIKAGSIKVLLTEKFENIDKNITIKEDSDGLLSEDIYEFNIKNIGDAPAKFDLKLINEVPNSYTGDILGLEYIKVGLEVNGEEHGPMTISEANNIIDSDILYEKEVINYTLRIWLDKTKEEELQEKEDYKAFLKLRVEAEQRPGEMDPGVITETFDYTGTVQEYTAPRDGEYKLEVWGAQGGGYGANDGSYRGGYGGYSTGTVRLTGGEKLYIYVGGAGLTSTSQTANLMAGGYNGGGNSYGTTSKYTGSGGGATHIATTSGLLSTLENKQDKLLIVAGGGGGAGYESSWSSTGGNGGGIEGTNGTKTSSESFLPGAGGTQNSGGTTYQGTATFGQGANATADSIGGGGGYYGGGSGQYTSGGGGGSGYIGNSLLKDKSMYCYNCTESSNTSTKTFSTTSVSDNAVSMYAKKDNGYAKISFVNK